MMGGGKVLVGIDGSGDPSLLQGDDFSLTDVEAALDRR
jgi:hypothetical protein